LDFNLKTFSNCFSLQLLATYDPRVVSSEPGKMAARLQAATSSGKPVLPRVDYDAGHGIGSTKTQRGELYGDIFSLALWQFGVAGFQPAVAAGN
jgi:prolyl oligopeptidase